MTSRNIRSTAESLEKKQLLKRIYRRTDSGDYDTTVFDLTPLLTLLRQFSKEKEDKGGGTDDFARTPTDGFVRTGTDENIRRIKQRKNTNKTNGEENEISPFLRLKGLSEGQIVNLQKDKPDLDLDRAEKMWTWIKKTKYFKNKPAVFYTALLEGWSLPSGKKKKDLPWM